MKGSEFRKKRHQLGISMTKAAKEIGCARSTLKKFETGETVSFSGIYLDRAIKFCNGEQLPNLDNAPKIGGGRRKNKGKHRQKEKKLAQKLASWLRCHPSPDYIKQTDIVINFWEEDPNRVMEIYRALTSDHDFFTDCLNQD